MKVSDMRKEDFKENANIRYCMANLKSAVNKYYEFCNQIMFKQKNS